MARADSADDMVRSTRNPDFRPAIAMRNPGYDEPGALASDASVDSTLGATELIEPGRSLALANFAAPSVSAGERFIRLAYRIGVPGSALVSPFAKPQRPRLLATVANPLPGNKSAGTALRAGHFLVHGLKLPIAQIDFAGVGRLTPPVERMVHGFRWLADLEAAAPREQVAAVAERILTGWLAANGRLPGKPGKGAAWGVANTGHRLLGWLVHAPLILSGPDKALARPGADDGHRHGAVAGPPRSSRRGCSGQGGGLDRESSPPGCCCPMAARAACMARPG